ncbi:hypothetical protein [Streptomyces blattellae]|uniref:hypothetical protein n=1 Tax=Streptomyces blattellae TaxID=2569855 RepID=UPI0012B892A9|nr:hypothetical protein [Streptomyces blattellae]
MVEIDTALHEAVVAAAHNLDTGHLPLIILGLGGTLLLMGVTAEFGSASVGWYVTFMAVLSLICLLFLPETREREPMRV